MRICPRNASRVRPVSGTSAIPFGVFESGDPDHCVLQIHLFLLHRHQIGINSFYTRSPDSVMIRMMLRKYSGAWNSIRCCSDQPT